MLNVHTAFRRDDERDALGCTVGHDRHIVFVLDVCTVFNEQTAYFLTHRAGLVRDQLHAQNFAGEFFDIVNRARQLHAAALAASARVNLRFDHPDGAAQFLRRFNRFLHGESGNAARHRNAELT